MTTPPRSSFVTVLAWIFIVLSGFAAFIALLQNVMLAFVFPMAEMQASIEKAGQGPAGQGFPVALFGYIRYVFLAFLVLSAGTLASAIGLLRRRNWARILFIALMALAIAWQLAGVGFMYWMFSIFPPVPTPPKHPEMAGRFQAFQHVMLAINAVVAVAFAVLFTWIIRRLLAPEIRREFGVPP